MAIKLPDPGNGIPEQKTGNDEWTNMKIVRDNFADQSNAANKTVGTANGQIPLADDVQKANYARITDYNTFGVSSVGALPVGSVALFKPSYNASDYPNKTGLPSKTEWHITTLQVGAAATNLKQIALTNSFNDVNELATRGLNSSASGGEWQPWAFYYHTGNTTKDSNGFLKSASPVVDLYDNRIELNNDAEKQGGITFEKLGTGNYLVKGSLGFAREGWYIEMPKDANGNVLVAVVYEQLENNDISVKTFDYMLNKKGRIVPDTETPLDIPEGRCINLRLHEELLDEPI